MKPHKTAVRELIHKIIAPSVLVLPTNAAEAITRKNGLSFIDMLRPLAMVDTSSVSVNTTREQPFRIPHMHINFCEPGDVEQAPPELLDMSLEAVVRSSEPADDDKQLNNQYPTWLEDYRDELERGLRSSEHESLHHPLACMLVASVDEPDLVPTLLSLSSMESLPPLFREGVIDPNMLKHYVLIQDMSAPGVNPSRGEEMVRGIREAFGVGSCSLLRMNSQPDTAPLPLDIWTASKPLAPRVMAPPPNGSLLLGCLLSPEDLRAQQQLVSEFTLKALLPHLDKRVRTLNQQVVAVRKGLKNQFKSWGTSLFGKASSESSREGMIEGAEPRYLFHSVEAQIRSLAETAAMLQDYDLALSSYRLLIPDLKRDKAHRAIGLANFAAALCMFMAEQKKNQQDEYLDAAYTAFVRVSLPRHCVLVSLLHAKILRSQDRYAEAAERLIRGTGGEADDLGAAVLYEDAAQCFMQAVPVPQMRKSALHLVHAGHRYLKSGVKAHGVRCYGRALEAYQGKGWTHILDHLLAALAKHSLNLNRILPALSYYVQLLSNQEGKPADRQQIYLRDFLAVVRQNAPTHLERRLALPVLVHGTMQIELTEPVFESEGDGDFADHGAQGLRWSDLEETLVDPARWHARVEHSKSTLINLRKALPPPCPRNPRAMVIGEPTAVTVTLRNPLHLPLLLSGLTLAYRFTEAQPDKDPSPETWEPSDQAEGKLQVEDLELELPAGAAKTVRIKVCGIVEGWVEVVGVVCRLGGQGGVRCFQPVVLPKRRLKAKHARGKDAAYVADTSLRVRVVRAMPRLVGMLHGLEGGWWRQGQLVKGVIELRNEGTRPAHGLRLAMSHQHAVALRPPAELDSDPLVGKHDDGSDEPISDAPLVVAPDGDSSSPVVDMCVGAIEPGGVVLLPLWVRPPSATPLSIRLLVHYIPPPADEQAMKYRLVKLSANLDVRPSLHAGLHVRWAGGATREKLVVAVEMQGAGEGLELLDVACISERWRVSLLSSQSIPSAPPRLPPHAQAVWLLQLKSHKEGGVAAADRVTFAFPGRFLGHALGKALEALVHGLERAEGKGHAAAAATRMLVIWRDAQSGAVGFHHLACPMPAVTHNSVPASGPPPSPTKQPPEGKAREAASPDAWPVRVRIDAPQQAFAPAGTLVCEVCVTLVLHGVVDESVRVLVEAIGGGNETGRGWDYEWGGTVRTALTVPAREDAKVRLKAIVRQPSTVNLNRICLSFPDCPNLAPLHLPSTRFQHFLQVDSTPASSEAAAAAS